MMIDTDTLAALLDDHYDGQPLDDYDRALLTDQLIDTLPDDHPDVELARSGVWRGTLAGWREVGPGLVQRMPLVRVELVDRKPSYTADSPQYRSDLRGEFCWYLLDDDPDLPFRSYHLPPAWYGEAGERHWIPAGKTLKLALDDASRRAIAWARSKAKETA